MRLGRACARPEWIQCRLKSFERLKRVYEGEVIRA